MKTIHGNILDVKEGYICHQVNSKGVMGAGLALMIRRKWPKVYEDYVNLYREGGLTLGSISMTKVDMNLWVVNIVGQETYGYGGRYTDYNTFKLAISTLKPVHDNNEQIYFPYGIGCGLAGGDWDIVSDIIEHELPNAIIIKYDGK